MRLYIFIIFVSLVLSPSISRADACADELSKDLFVGKSYTVSSAIDVVANFLPKEMSAQFLRNARTKLSGLQVESKDISFDKIKLKYRNRFIDFRSHRNQSARIVWSSRPVETREQLDQLIEATIDLFSEASFMPVRRHTIYSNRPSSFTSDNMEVLKEKLLLKMFALGEDSAEPAPGALRSVYEHAKTVFKATLPMQFSSVRTLRLNQNHIAAFQRGGPQELYRYIKFHDGIGLAVRYWFNHLTNLKAAIIFAYASVMAPRAVESWEYFAQLQRFEASSPEQYELANRMYKSMNTPSDEVMAEIRKYVNSLPPQERAAIESALASTEPLSAAPSR